MPLNKEIFAEFDSKYKKLWQRNILGGKLWGKKDMREMMPDTESCNTDGTQKISLYSGVNDRYSCLLFLGFFSNFLYLHQEKK